MYMDELYPVAKVVSKARTTAPGFEQVILPGGQIMSVHAKDSCSGYWCPIHYPSQHHMRSWTQFWVKGVMYRVCKHDIEHPDPDDWRWRLQTEDTRTATDRHTLECDGCCKRPFDDEELT